MLHRGAAAAAQRAAAPAAAPASAPAASAPASAPATASAAEMLPPQFRYCRPLAATGLWLPPSVETPLGSCEPSPLASPTSAEEPVLSPAPGPRRERKTSWLGASLGAASCASGWSLSATEGVGWPSLSASGGSVGGSGRAELSAWLSLLTALPEHPLWRLVRRLEQQGEHRAAADVAAAWLEARASASALASTRGVMLEASAGAAACGATRHEGARQVAAWYVQRRWRRQRWRLARTRSSPHSR